MVEVEYKMWELGPEFVGRTMKEEYTFRGLNYEKWTRIDVLEMGRDTDGRLARVDINKGEYTLLAKYEDTVTIMEKEIVAF